MATLLDKFIESGLNKRRYLSAVKRADKRLRFNDIIDRNSILEANRYGIKTKDRFDSYRTPILSLAMNAGRYKDIDLSNLKDVWIYRYGSAPEIGISHNYRDDVSEKSLSAAGVIGETEHIAPGSIRYGDLLGDRDMYVYQGLLLPYKGSDGEPLIIPYYFENLD